MSKDRKGRLKRIIAPVFCRYDGADASALSWPYIQRAAKNGHTSFSQSKPAATIFAMLPSHNLEPAVDMMAGSGGGHVVALGEARLKNCSR